MPTSSIPLPIPILRWTPGTTSANDPALSHGTTPAHPQRLPLSATARYHRLSIDAPADGTLLIELTCPRPLRLRALGERILDEPLAWTSFQRVVRAAVIVPVPRGAIDIDVEIGPRSRHPEGLDVVCPSRNRAGLMRALAQAIRDELTVSIVLIAGASAPAVSLRFHPGQFLRDGAVWQEIMLRPIPGFARMPSIDVRTNAMLPPEAIHLSAATWPGQVHDATAAEDRVAGLRRVYVPVRAPGEPVPIVRTPGPDARLEPVVEIVGTTVLTVEGPGGRVDCALPIHETLGRLAPQREFRELTWPDHDRLLAALPEPVLPPELDGLKTLYRETWRMLLTLVRRPALESGMPNSYIATAGQGFTWSQFVWDTSFTAMSTAYGWRALPAHASIDLLYTRQFDGGYIHRETNLRDGMPFLYEPDFSPNPPIISVAEWQIASLSGDVGRLRRVYPALRDQHLWLDANRKLPDGTFWSTGLANGLDNSPSLGDGGYPDLTAQMAHDADTLARIAAAIGLPDEAAAWRARQRTIGEALNRHLWSERMRFYSTGLSAGGHHPNKVVTGFWPLWADVVPADRVEDLARHLQDPKSFGRHHPVPSLAADAPEYVTGGDYWRGSTWAPTNYATIKGFQRAGRHGLARATALRHLTCMREVFEATGHIWENYAPDASAPGSTSGPDYCWTSLGPIALLFETIIGLEPDAFTRTLRFTPQPGQKLGANRYPLGAATVSICQIPEADHDRVDVETDLPITVEVVRDGKVMRMECAAGRTSRRV